MEIREENKEINAISNKFLDFLTTIVEEQEQLRSEIVDELDTYYYITDDILEVLNKDKIFFAEEIEKDKNKEYTFINYLKKILPDIYASFLNSIKNYYYLKNSDISSEVSVPQEKKCLDEINKFMNRLNQYVCRINPDLFTDSLNKTTDYIENIMDLANEIEYGDAISNIDLLEKTLEKSLLTPLEKKKFIEYLIKNNISKYKAKNIDDIEQMSELDEKLSDLEDLITSDFYLKRLISLIEDISFDKISLDNYKIDGSYGPDVQIYIDYERNIIRKYLEANPSVPISSAVEMFYKNSDNKKSNNIYYLYDNNIYYLHDNNISFISEDFANLDKDDKLAFDSAVKSLKNNELNFRKSNNNYSTLNIYDARTIKNNGLAVTYIPINDNNVILLGVTNKKLKDHYNIMENRAKKCEEQIVSIMKQKIQDDCFFAKEESSNKDEIEILDEEDSKYAKVA